MQAAPIVRDKIDCVSKVCAAIRESVGQAELPDKSGKSEEEQIKLGEQVAKVFAQPLNSPNIFLKPFVRCLPRN